MDLQELIGMVYEGILRLLPLFRVVWVGTVVLGAALLVLAFVLKRDSARKKSPWIVGGIALVMIISSGSQLAASFI